MNDGAVAGTAGSAAASAGTPADAALGFLVLRSRFVADAALPAGSVHLVAKNTGTEKTIIIAFVENPKGAPLSTPMDEHGK